jgi:hypothetical protein
VNILKVDSSSANQEISGHFEDEGFMFHSKPLFSPLATIRNFTAVENLSNIGQLANLMVQNVP